MQRAKAHGIDAFALNIGVDPYTDTQLNFAYESAANNDMKVFISFDFNWWSINQPTAIGQEVAQYASRPAQLMVDNKVFVSSFAGDGVDVAQMQAAAGRDIYFVPNFHPGVGDFSTIQGALSWMAWPSNGRNRAPTAANNVSVAEADQMYLDALNGKPYMARKYVNFHVRMHVDLLQPRRPGSSPISATRSPTARTGCSRPTSSGTTAGTRSCSSARASSSTSPGTTTASRIIRGRSRRRTPTTAPPSG